MHGLNSRSGDETLKLRDRGIRGSGDLGIGGSNQKSQDQTVDRGIMILRSRDKSFGLRGSSIGIAGSIGGSEDHDLKIKGQKIRAQYLYIFSNLHIGVVREKTRGKRVREGF